MARKTGKELEELKIKHGVRDIFSWSRYSCYKNSPYEFFLKYILDEESDMIPSIYLVSGGLCHEIIEDYYNGVIKYEEMILKYEEGLFNMNLQDLKYNRVDEEKNLNIGNSYEGCIREFFKNHSIIKDRIFIEKYIDIKVGKYFFQGYIDATIKKDDYVIIGDWKTSTIYTGKKAEKESGQLKLYTLGLYKKGIPLDKILYGWNFLKYYSISYMQKNGKLNTLNIERNIDPMETKALRNNIISTIKDKGYNLEDYEMYKFKELPEDIKSEYKIDDCWILSSITERELLEFEKEIEDDLDGLYEKIDEYNIREDEEIWMGEVIDASNSYYFNNLCSFSFKKHKPFAEYIENAKMFMID